MPSALSNYGQVNEGIIKR